MVESIKNRIKIVFPNKEKPDLAIQIDFMDPLSNLIDSLKKHLILSEDFTLSLCKDQKSELPINKNLPAKEQKIESDSTLFCIIKKKSLKISISKQYGELSSFEIPGRTKKLKEIKIQILTKLDLPTSGTYDIIRVRDQTTMQDDQDFSSFVNQEIVKIVTQEPLEDSTLESCFVKEDASEAESQDHIKIYFPLANKVVKFEISENKVENLQQISKFLFADYNGHFEFFHFGVKVPVSTNLKTWISDRGRAPPLVCYGPNKINDAYKNYIPEISVVWDEPFSSEPIPLVIDAKIKNNKAHAPLLKNIREAVAKFDAETPIKFLELADKTQAKFYFAWVRIYLSEKNEIVSTVGRGAGNNPIHIKSDTPTYAIMHELMHALGFVHEHQRPDRDLFLDIDNKDRTDPDFYVADTYFPIGVYDPKSIMHYHFYKQETQLKSDGLLTDQEKKILLKPSIPTKFSEGDTEAIEFIYGSKLTCTIGRTGKKFASQSSYECITCWGRNSGVGCCTSCKKFCHNGHEVIYHKPGIKNKQFFCDCGVNKHKLGCTKASTGGTPCEQPMFTSEDCHNEGPICFPCAKILNCDPKERKENLIEGVCTCKNECCNTRTRSLLNI